MVDLLYIPKNDLKIAESEIERMSKTTNFTDFQEYWQNYLMRIERAWESTVRLLRSKKGFQQWIKPYSEFRKNDSLLKFLRQARNAEAHNVSTTVTKSLKIIIKEKTGRNFQLNSVKSKLEDGIWTIDIDSPDILLDMGLEVIPTDPEVSRFKNRNKWYNAPWDHMGKPIKDLHPVSLAILGLSFYKTLISEAEFWVKVLLSD